jgi:hypothetical protein
MNQDRRADTGFDRLPGELVDWLAKPFASFLRIEAAGGAILLVVTIAALALSNSPWADPFLTFWELPVGIRIGSLEVTRSLRAWINDALMTPELFRNTAPAGDRRRWQRRDEARGYISAVVIRNDHYPSFSWTSCAAQRRCVHAQSRYLTMLSNPDDAGRQDQGCQREQHGQWRQQPKAARLACR